MVKLQWEELEQNQEEHAGTCYRAPVIGGWLVKSLYFAETHMSNGGLTFIPDPTHIWA